MTRTDIDIDVSFRVLFTIPEVLALKKGADSHYDAVCRHFQPLMILTQYIAHDLEPSIRLSWRDLDILSKICESPLVPEHIAHSVWSMFKDLRQLSDTLNKQHSAQTWQEQKDNFLALVAENARANPEDHFSYSEAGGKAVALVNPGHNGSLLSCAHPACREIQRQSGRGMVKP